MSQPKVVALNTASKKPSSLPPIVLTMRQHARKKLSKLLEGLFNNVDDALFEMADRSRSDTDQHLYFESMRELRLKRELICKTFAQEFSLGVELAFRGVDEETPPEEPDFDQVSILDNDELEISVAVAGIVSKITSQHSLLVMQLTKRIDHLAKDTEITERSNPMGPELLSQAFVTALKCADLEIKVRIILLKLFERFVMERLTTLYTESNQLLAEAGVLTDLQATLRSNRASARRSARSDSESRTESGSSLESGDTTWHDSGSYGGSSNYRGSRASSGFQLIQELLASNRGGASDAGTGGYTGNSGRSGNHRALSTADVLGALTEAQAQLQAPIDLESVPPLLDLRQVVISGSGNRSQTLAQADDDVVNFVGMLFDYILNDRNLAIPMKALIGRLQLPIVKLSIMDRSFFDKSGHPARQLLNELSSAGIGWSSAKELKRDALYNKVESVVLRVMNGFAEDPQIFQELLVELREFMKADRRKREQVERRVKDNEKGRAKTINAKQTVQKLINQKASGMRLPAEVGKFVSDTWSKVLVYTCVKDGDRSPAWHQRAETLDLLLWALQPLDNLDDIEQREKKLPGLLENLKAGMAEIQLPETEVERRIAEVTTHLSNISSNDRAYLETDEEAPEDDSFEIMDEIVLTLPGEQLDAPSDVDVEPEFIEQVGKLREGMWVELSQPGAELLRCKLSTIIEPGGRYIFVNRRGMKVAERSRRGLAVELKRKSLTILEESQVFDRALQAVIGNLRQMHRSPAAK